MNAIFLAAELSLTSLRGHVPLRAYGGQAPFLAWAAFELGVPSTLPTGPLPTGDIFARSSPGAIVTSGHAPFTINHATTSSPSPSLI